MPTIESERGRDDAQRDTKRPISLRAELTILIVVSSVLAFKLAWIATMIGLNGWIAPPIAIASTQVFTYVTSRHLTRPLAQMIDAAQTMAEGDYSARVHIKKNSRDEVGELADAFNIMADELEHADQMRRDMIANVSHELRTPVSALQAMAENMADGIVEPTPANLESILTQTHRLSDLISFLLDLSRLEAGAASLEIVPINLAEFISETTGPLEYADAGHGHTIEQRIPDDLNLEGDEARLHQLFTNIIANALKHSPDNTARPTATARTTPSWSMWSTSGRISPNQSATTYSAASSKASPAREPNRAAPASVCPSRVGRRNSMAAPCRSSTTPAASTSQSCCPAIRRSLNRATTNHDRSGARGGVWARASAASTGLPCAHRTSMHSRIVAPDVTMSSMTMTGMPAGKHTPLRQRIWPVTRSRLPRADAVCTDLVRMCLTSSARCTRASTPHAHNRSANAPAIGSS